VFKQYFASFKVIVRQSNKMTTQGDILLI